MTTSITENREPAQATATAAGKPEPPKNAKVAAPKPRVAPAKAKSAKKATPAKKAVKAARQATPAKADRVRQGSKTARVLELVKRSGGATLKHLVKATGWQPHSVRGFLSTLGKKMALKIEPARLMTASAFTSSRSRIGSHQAFARPAMAAAGSFRLDRFVLP